jgi:hypothetical protein
MILPFANVRRTDVPTVGGKGPNLVIPFVRTAGELESCLRLVDESALGADQRLERWIMAEVPSVSSTYARTVCSISAS